MHKSAELSSNIFMILKYNDNSRKNVMQICIYHYCHKSTPCLGNTSSFHIGFIHVLRIPDVLNESDSHYWAQINIINSNLNKHKCKNTYICKFPTDRVYVQRIHVKKTPQKSVEPMDGLLIALI